MVLSMSASDLRVAYGDATIIPELSFGLRQGEITAILGPNGSGKSTALRAMARLVRPVGGSIHLDGDDIARLSTREIAKRLAVLPQSSETPAGITVRTLVGYGRYPHQGLFARPGNEDREAIEWALAVTGMEGLADRVVDTLSGGERQRAWIAMALAQRTDLLLLDEPTTYLDIRHQLDLLSLVRRLNREQGITVGWVLHDLNQAAAYSDYVVMLRDGRKVAEGPPLEVITRDHIRAVFDVDVEVIIDRITGCPSCLLYQSRIAREMEAAATG